MIIKAGQIWHDNVGNARVLAVAEGYVMLRRRRSNPFIQSAQRMREGKDGWQLSEEAPRETEPA